MRSKLDLGEGIWEGFGLKIRLFSTELGDFRRIGQFLFANAPEENVNLSASFLWRIRK